MMFLALSASLALAAPAGPELTIYNQGFGLVKEQRVLQLKAGVQQVPVQDVAQMIEASSVGIRSVSEPGSFQVLEQNYQYDLINSLAILNKAVGGRIAINRVLPNGTKERLVGTLLSSPTAVVSQDGGSHYTYNGLVLQADDGRIILDPSGEIEVTSLPEGLISKPTLVWEIDSERAGPNTVELSYLTGGMSWTSDYVLSLDQAGKKADLKGWVTLTNNSGATFKDAKLKLLAGDVQRIRDGGFARGGAMRPESAMKAQRDMVEEQFSEYHLYTLDRPTNVRNREQKQVSLLERTGISVTKRLVFDAMRDYRGYRPAEGEVGTGNLKPQVRIELINSKENEMGLPLPAGKFKIFQRDSKGSLQMLGEDQIEHTPRNEKLSLVVGEAFDIVADRKRTSFEYIRTNGVVRGARQTFEIEVRNRKETPESVDILERNWGEFKVTKSNIEAKKLDSETLLFVMELKANETRKLVYTVENYW